ncbi:MAG: hypothetical protein U0T77_12585 [Chitinophagales bacterium]
MAVRATAATTTASDSGKTMPMHLGIRSNYLFPFERRTTQLVRGETLAIDGTKVRAHNGRSKTSVPRNWNVIYALRMKAKTNEYLNAWQKMICRKRR